MAFSPKTWVDRLSEFPNRRRLDSTGIANTYDVTRSEGAVTTEGDKLDAATMNDLEERISAAFEGTATTEDLKALAGKSVTATTTVAAVRWTGTAAPYSQTITLTGAKPEPTRIEVQPSNDATADQWAAWRAALIRGGSQDTDTITLLADGDKPTIDIPMVATIRGDVS